MYMQLCYAFEVVSHYIKSVLNIQVHTMVEKPKPFLEYLE